MIQLQSKKFDRLLETWSMVIKASGLDEISGYFKKHILKMVFDLLLQNYLTNSTIWTFPPRLAHICYYTTVQKGDHTNPDNYNGISLLSMFFSRFE